MLAHTCGAWGTAGKFAEQQVSVRVPSYNLPRRAVPQTALPAFALARLKNRCPIRRMEPVQPTPAELSILLVLWRRGPSTVREVHEAVYAKTNIGYTSALKLMQNMLAKGLVTRLEDARRHIYSATAPRRPTLNRLVGGWIDSAFGGSSLDLVMHALDARPISRRELAELKAKIASLEKDADIP